MDHRSTSGRPIDDTTLSALRRVIDAEEAIDLHSHSRHSDGVWTPSELIEEAQTVGLKLLSLTDHDNVGGQEAAAAAAAATGIVFLTGMEVSLTVEGRLYHVLCYDFDWSSPTWLRFAEARSKRFEAAYLSQFDQFRARGYDLNPDLAREPDGRLATDPLAVALYRSGQVATIEEARQRIRSLYLRWPAELLYQDVGEFGALLRPGEAVFSVAHPARQEVGVSVRLTEDDLGRLMEAIPLVALEAHHPYHSAADVDRYRALAKERGLAVSCGSDAHGHQMRRPLRQHPSSMADEFLSIIRDRWVARVPAVAARG